MMPAEPLHLTRSLLLWWNDERRYMRGWHPTWNVAIPMDSLPAFRVVTIDVDRGCIRASVPGAISTPTLGDLRHMIDSIEPNLGPVSYMRYRHMKEQLRCGEEPCHYTGTIQPIGVISRALSAIEVRFVMSARRLFSFDPKTILQDRDLPVDATEPLAPPNSRLPYYNPRRSGRLQPPSWWGRDDT